jgi:hypothetical protein
MAKAADSRCLLAGLLLYVMSIQDVLDCRIPGRRLSKIAFQRPEWAIGVSSPPISI